MQLYIQTVTAGSRLGGHWLWTTSGMRCYAVLYCVSYILSFFYTAPVDASLVPHTLFASHCQVNDNRPQCLLALHMLLVPLPISVSVAIAAAARPSLSSLSSSVPALLLTHRSCPCCLHISAIPSVIPLAFFALITRPDFSNWFLLLACLFLPPFTVPPPG